MLLVNHHPGAKCILSALVWHDNKVDRRRWQHCTVPTAYEHFLYPVVPFHELKKIYTLIYAIPSWITRWPTESKMRGKKAHALGEDRTHDLQISLWSFGLWDWRAAYCATEAARMSCDKCLLKPKHAQWTWSSQCAQRLDFQLHLQTRGTSSLQY